jgi:hypothetical protein
MSQAFVVDTQNPQSILLQSLLRSCQSRSGLKLTVEGTLAQIFDEYKFAKIRIDPAVLAKALVDAVGPALGSVEGVQELLMNTESALGENKTCTPWSVYKGLFELKLKPISQDVPLEFYTAAVVQDGVALQGVPVEVDLILKTWAANLGNYTHGIICKMAQPIRRLT